MSNSGAIKGTTYVATSTNNNNCLVYDTKAKMGNSTSFACTSPDDVTFISYNETSNCMYQGQAATFPANSNCNIAYDAGMVYGYSYLTCNTGVPASSAPKESAGGLRGAI